MRGRGLWVWGLVPCYQQSILCTPRCQTQTLARRLHYLAPSGIMATDGADIGKRGLGGQPSCLPVLVFFWYREDHLTTFEWDVQL